MPRTDRSPDALRPLTFDTSFLMSAAGACLVSFGNTRVLCAATVEESVPNWMAGKGRGWVTAEYNMLPASTGRRKTREGRKGGGIDGRTAEIQRLVGRALRPVVDLNALGERTIWVDCDVIEADGGTRCASVCGAYVALSIAIRRMMKAQTIKKNPLVNSVAAVSVSVHGGIALLDPNYVEDVGGDADMNVVMDGQDRLIELQTTAEGTPIDESTVISALALARRGLVEIRARQEAAIAEALR